MFLIINKEYKYYHCYFYGYNALQSLYVVYANLLLKLNIK